MHIFKYLRWVLYVVGGLIAGILLILVILAFVPISIDLSDYKGAVESAATLALGRTVKVDNKIIIATELPVGLLNPPPKSHLKRNRLNYV